MISILTKFTVAVSALSAVSGFRAHSVSKKYFSAVTERKPNLISTTAIFSTPENFSDVAETIADAARSLRGQTIVVKYGGVGF